MKNSIFVAVAGGLLLNTVGFGRSSKKHDLFYQADMRSRKCCAEAKNVRVISLSPVKHIV